jgi:hypothetical protein
MVKTKRLPKQDGSPFENQNQMIVQFKNSTKLLHFIQKNVFLYRGPLEWDHSMSRPAL